MATKRRFTPKRVTIERQILEIVKRNNGKETIPSISAKIYGEANYRNCRAIAAHLYKIRQKGVTVYTRGSANQHSHPTVWLDGEGLEKAKQLTDPQLREMGELVTATLANAVKMWELAQQTMLLNSREYEKVVYHVRNAQRTYFTLYRMAESRGWNESRLWLVFGKHEERDFR